MRVLAAIIFLMNSSVAMAQTDTDLFALINENDVAGVVAALEQGADPDQRQTAGLEATPLMWATGGADPAILAALIEAGADVNAVDTMGDPAINWASYYGNIEAIALLLGAGADTSLTGHGNAQEILMRRGHQDALRFLLNFEERLPNRSETEVEIVEALIADLPPAVASVDVSDYRDFAGRPALQAAARANAVNAIRWLVGQGEDVDAVDAIGFSALFEAARDGQSGAVNVLLELGADASLQAHENALSLTALHMAATGDHADIVAAIIAAGADVDAQGTMGGTALMWAVFEGSRDAARALLESGADPGIASNDGSTFVSIAAQRGWDDLVELAESRLD
jgi:ankyrin repeat protein